MFMTFDEIVDDMMLFRLDVSARISLRSVSKEELVAVHHLLGRPIRQKYELMDVNNPLTLLNYVADIQNGVDLNPKHPDNVSKRIIETIWSRLQ